MYNFKSNHFVLSCAVKLSQIENYHHSSQSNCWYRNSTAEKFWCANRANANCAFVNDFKHFVVIRENKAISNLFPNGIDAEIVNDSKNFHKVGEFGWGDTCCAFLRVENYPNEFLLQSFLTHFAVIDALQCFRLFYYRRDSWSSGVPTLIFR